MSEPAKAATQTLWRSQWDAARAVAAVLEGRSLTYALAEAWRRGEAADADRGRIQDLAFGAVRHLARLRAILAQLLRKPLAAREIEALLLVALQQLETERTGAHAVVHEAVTASRMIDGGRTDALVNAVLRNFLRRREELVGNALRDETARLGYPRWWIEAVRGQYPRQWRRLLELGNGHPPMALRVNRRRSDPDAYLAMLQGAGIDARRSGEAGILLERPVPVSRLPGFADGLASVQDLGAQQAAPLLALQPGQRVLDACAAPGGKAAHMLEVADVDLLAIDSDAARLERVADNFRRLSLGGRVLQGDAAEPAQWWDGRPFQRILADVPCSASGVVRRHPDVRWLRRAEDLPQLAAAQGAILDGLWQTLEPGGTLLYVTCSLFEEENSRVVARFLERHPDAQSPKLPGRGASQWPLLPDADHDGFFFALLAKA